MHTIDPQRVEEIFLDCLFREDELEDGKPKLEEFPIVEGIQHKVGLHPERVEKHKDEIVKMLALLPKQFHTAETGGGGGWSFLQACDDINGAQWTGLHLRMDQLFTLGTAIGKVKSQLPREVWSALPGGMPYYAIDLA